MEKILFISMGGTAEKGWDSITDQNGYSKDSRVFNYLEKTLGIGNLKMITLCQCESTEITEDNRKQLSRVLLQEKCYSVVLIHGENSMPETVKSLLAEPELCGTIVGMSTNIPIGCEGNDVLLLLGYAAACAQILPAGIYLCKKPFEYLYLGDWKHHKR